jgi:energy-coupling factor transport system permease protein
VKPALAYAPGGRLAEVNALAATVYLGSLGLTALIFSSPIVIAGAGAAVVLAGLATGSGAAVRAAARWGLTLGVLVAVVNALVSTRGDTVLIRGFDLPVIATNISAEALADGAVLGLRFVVVIMVFAVHSASVDPDQLLRLVRPLARRSALTATVITRMVPLAAADYARLAEAAGLRGPAAAPVGRAILARRLVAGSLDRATDIAATLELRGYARGAPAAAGRLRRSRHDAAFLAAGLVIATASIIARAGGIGGFDAYPGLSVDAGALTIALAASLPLLAAIPFGGARG